METYCPFPFVGICVRTGGGIVPCCNADSKDVSSPTCTSEDYEEAFRSESFDTLRDDLLAGNRPTACNHCWRIEDVGGRSPRLLAIKEFGTPTKPDLQYADIKFDNKCNLSCRMCTPWSSSKIEQIVRDYPDHPDVFYSAELPDTPIQDISDPDTKCIRTKRLIDNGLTHLKVTGGEPFLSEHYIDVLKYAIDCGRSAEMDLSLTTNCTLFADDVMSLLVQFRSLKVTMSIDGFGKTYDYIRHPYTWGKLVERIHKFFNAIELSSIDVMVFTTMTMSVYNVFDINALSSFWDSITKKYTSSRIKIKPISPNWYLKPYDSPIRVQCLPEIIKQMIDVTGLQGSWSAKSAASLIARTVWLDNLYGRSYEDYLDPRLVSYLDGLKSK